MAVAPHCTVVIPTKNAMPRFASVLDATLRQKTPWPFDVIIIDSGSSDGTVAYAQAQSNLRVVCIPPEDFGHGRTRNLAVTLTDAPFVAFLTHDAQPADNSWLVKLVAAVEQDDNIAGAFGRHIAWPEASPFTRRDLEQHFAGFLAHPLVVSRALDPDRYDRDIGWRQFLHFYSDNNSCLRRSVWQNIPYPDVEFAEDQIWAREIIDMGHAKAYAPDAVVRHSHDYGLFERLQRSFDESRNFQKYFGYRLAPDISQAWRSIVGLSARDFRYGRRNTDERLIPVSQVLHQIVLNVALVAGHYLGTRHNRIPAGIQRILSRDAAMFHQKRAE